MALTATVYRVQVALSDVDRGVYESLDLRLAQHPSESMRYLATRLLAYCLSYEEGIAFSKGGISSTDEPPIAVRDLTGVLTAWIEVGAPSAERLHKATKAARRVALFTSQDLVALRKEAATIHRAAEVEVLKLDPAFLDAIPLERNTKLELVRNEDHLYLTVDGKTLESTISALPLSQD